MTDTVHPDTVVRTLLAIENVTKTFGHGKDRRVHAVKSASLSVGRGEIVALVGESGSGKSTLGRIALGLERPDAGRVMVQGRDLQSLSADALRIARLSMQPVFQDATASLNPRRTVGELLGQALRFSKHAVRSRSIAALEQVGLRPAPEFLHRMPYELSGGQRQRVAIARAIAADPLLIIADEPLSGADVSIRGQVLNLLLDIKDQRDMAYLIITHDISIARHFADRVAVMCQGEIVECGVAASVLDFPQHPYTRRLLQAVPVLPHPD
jgi:ABC-type glutathione transport system ATPase component